MTDVTAGAPAAPPASGAEFMGHPRGLVTLFFTEMWERFSFYGMRALLTLYLVQHFLFSDGKAQALYGAYAALVYLMPVIGGFLADRFLGARKAVTIGAVLLVLGHFGMAFEGGGSKQFLVAGQEKLLVTSEGRGEANKLYLALPEGPTRLKFEQETLLVLAGPGEAPRQVLREKDYAIATEPETLLGGLCVLAGFRCAPAPESTLSVQKGPPVPIQIDGETKRVTLDGVSYGVELKKTRDAIAFNPGATEEKEDDVELRRFADGAYGTEVEQEPLFVQILFVSLALIIVGVGFLKANISTTVGALYAPDDPRRDGGFTIFYMGINLGAFLATLVCGYLGQTYGWAYGFGAAGIGMTFGLIQYLMGQKHLMGKAEPPRPLKATTEGLFWIGGLLAVIPAWLLVQQTEVMEKSLPVLVPAMFGALLLYALFGFRGADRGRMITALILTFFSVVFWMLFEQAGSSLSLFAERSTDLTVAPGVSMTAAQTQSFNAGFIVLLALPLSAAWVWLNKRGLEPSTPVKFALGLIQVGLGFFVLVAGTTYFAGADFKVPLIFLALLYLLHTTGELFLSPVGLSMITKLSAAQVVGLMMGVWFLSSSLAHILASMIAQRTAGDTIAGQSIDPAGQLATYLSVFAPLGVAGVAAGVVLLALSPLLKRWMAGVH